MGDLTLDLRDLRCPLPVLRTRKALRGCAPGTILTVQCTDPLAGVDIPHLVAENGDTLRGVDLIDGVQVFTIEKS